MTQQAGVSAERIAEWLHLKMSAAQNLPYNDGDTCEECVEAVREELLPLLATAPPEQAARHGYDCVKVRHETKRSGYLHDDLDDGPYDVDGVLYCGRCHIALSRSGISGKQLQAMLLTWFDRYHKFTDISVDMLPHQAAEKVFKELRQFVAESLI